MTETSHGRLTVGYCEDDTGVRRLLGECLRTAGHHGIAAGRSSEAMERFAVAGIDVLVVDIGLPDADGRDLARALRANGQQAPVVFLTGHDAPHDVVDGFNAGGLDYVVKPFAVVELLARVQALARRPRPATVHTGVRLDTAAHSLRSTNREQVLTPTEFRLLGALLAVPGRVVRRSELAAAAHLPGHRARGVTLDTYVHRVRRHLASVGATERIVTRRGIGYAIE